MQAAKHGLSNVKHEAFHQTLGHDSHIYRPSSPLSSAMHPAALRAPARLHPTPHTSKQRGTQNLNLPGLPRFHPANYSTSQDSTSSPPSYTSLDSLQPPVSPRQQHRQIADAQRHSHLYPRELAAYNRTGPLSPGILRTSRPTSPRLDPLGSPGPVTPFELEGTDGYLTARTLPTRQLSVMDKDEVMESFNRKQLQQQRDGFRYRSGSAPRSSTPSR